MKPEDRELIEHILNAAGTAGIQGFRYMVQYQFVGGITDVLTGITLLALAAYLFRWLVKWRDQDNEIPKGLGLVILSLFAVGMVCVVFTGVTEIFAPEGAAISKLLSH